MSNTNSGLKSVNELLELDFFIPSYQRGYRWSTQQVTDLLSDIWEFHQKERKEDKEYYCLQPIVVSKANDGRYIVIDGQQRLTSLHIIFSSLRELFEPIGKKRFKLEYETRPGSASFLLNLNPKMQNDNIDYFHMYQAYEATNNWFEEKNKTVRYEFLHTLIKENRHNIQVIWYEVDNSTSHIDVFTRLNMGKIPLTNAELIKALFLNGRNVSEETESKYVSLRQREIAHEWDVIEQKLHDEEFWYFLQDTSVHYNNRIEFIFDLIAVKVKSKLIDPFNTFHFFRQELEQASTDDVWYRIKRTYQTLLDWYHNRELFHIVGYLVSTGTSIQELLMESKGKTKSSFQESLREKVKRSLGDSEISDLTYDSDKNALRKVLLLFNVLSILENKDTNLRFQFGRYKKESWDIEHIHSVSSAMPNSKQHIKEWLQEVLNFTTDERLKNRIKEYLSAVPVAWDEFEVIYFEIIKKYSEPKEQWEGASMGKANDDNVDDISNLTLLDSGTNRGYKNAVFPVKRNIIIRKDESGTFIPLCTKNVFLKYYNHNIEQTTFWEKEDRKAYKNKLVSTITNFVEPVEDVN
jgi:hypothetical protein